MADTKIGIVLKNKREGKSFTAYSDASQYAGISVRAIQHRLSASSGYWEDRDMFILAMEYMKAEGKNRNR